MPLPEPILDDLRFQRDLVDEARRRIIRYCPEWTDYNVSDPGITLIELFAWMTELLVYRLNRVPEKNYIKFLELLDVQLKPPQSARTKLTFWLSVPFPVTPGDETTVLIPRGTEVATPYFEAAQEVIFTTDEDKVIYPPKLTQLRRSGEPHKNYLPRLNLTGMDAFGAPPQVGDTFYIGFDPEHDLSGHILQLTFNCAEDRGTGIRRRDPPLVWEVSLGQGRWHEVTPSTFRGEEDTTGGLNTATGNVVLYLPLEARPDEVHGRRAYWVRCRYEPRRPEQGRYTQSPRILDLSAYSRGATTWATHAQTQEMEMLGVSNGEPGQVFKLQHTPVLEPRADETVEVEELRDGEVVFVPWKRVQHFAHSTRYDRHYTLDLASGEIRFGPAIRQPDGTVRQYGRIPEARRRIRFTRYRYGGGSIGNVPAGKLQVLRSSLAYITRVSNLERAEGGRDQETLEEAKMRARREIRAQYRAVTAEDFETLTKSATRAVARVKCLAAGATDDPDTPMRVGLVDLRVVPAAYAAVEAGDLSRLHLDAPLRRTIHTHLDQYRLLTVPLQVREPRYIGVSVHAQIACALYSDPDAVVARVNHALHRFLTPLALPAAEGEENITQFLGPHWEGWPFGKDLYIAELFNLIQQVRGVQHVLNVEVRSRPIQPDKFHLDAGEEGSGAVGSNAQLTPVEGRALTVPPDALLCSLHHEIEIVEL